MSACKRLRASSSSSAAPPPAVATLVVAGDDATGVRAEMASLWREEVLLDCEVHVDGRRFEAHRLVLSASSAYMKSAFSNGLAEATSARIDLPDMRAATFEALLIWMYDGSATIAEASLPELLEAATRLQVPLLAAEAERLIRERIGPSNALAAWVLGDMHTLPALVAAAKKVALVSFAEAAATDEFTRLSAAWLEELLASDELVIEREEEVFRALKRWHAAQQPPATDEAVASLLRCVRWARMDKDFVQQHVNTDPMIKTHAMVIAMAYQALAFGTAPAARLGGAIECCFSSAFDTNGVLYHIATDGGTRPYANPHASGKVQASWSSCWNGEIKSFVQHSHAQPMYCYTKDKPNSWMAVDLGEGRSLLPNYYCLRADLHGTDKFKLRNWELQGSDDGAAWVTLRTHANDSALKGSMGTAAWPVEGADRAYRHFRILQTGPNSQGPNSSYFHNLICSGIELYGRLRGARAS